MDTKPRYPAETAPFGQIVEVWGAGGESADAWRVGSGWRRDDPDGPALDFVPAEWSAFEPISWDSGASRRAAGEALKMLEDALAHG